MIQHWTKKWNFNYRLNSFYQQACQECQFYFTFEQRVGFGFKSNTHPFSSCRAASKRPNGSFNRNSTQHGQAVTVLKFYSDWTLTSATYLACIKSPPAFYKRNFQLAIVNLNILNNFIGLLPVSGWNRKLKHSGIT